MFDIGMQELILIFIVALLVFGPKRLPELGRTIGKGMAEIKKAVHGVKEQMDSELRDIKDPLSSVKEQIDSELRDIKDPLSHLDVPGKTEKEATTAKDSKEKGAE
ncbi:MAG: Sec-independent protein translocase protein TatB [Thermodesulfovibrionales bacterium]|nr:Sec-independent protein translocase protein TatB [Nitrospinota bacterium]MDP3048323.1 Sec-independent protein translocase protein TatB [Thermodesulfovibrionales bacterium]